MNLLNSIIFEGNLTENPTLKRTPNGASVCNFTLASSRYYKKTDGEKGEDVTYIKCETWGKTAESCNVYLIKGRGVRVVGRIKQNRWKDSDGDSHSRIIITAEHVEFKPMHKHDIIPEVVDAKDK